MQTTQTFYGAEFCDADFLQCGHLGRVLRGPSMMRTFAMQTICDADIGDADILRCGLILVGPILSDSFRFTVYINPDWRHYPEVLMTVASQFVM